MKAERGHKKPRASMRNGLPSGSPFAFGSSETELYS